MRAPSLDRVRTLIEESLSIKVPSDATDLIDSGFIDSLALVSLIAELEAEFHVEFPLDDLDIDQFRSVRRISERLSGIAAAVT